MKAQFLKLYSLLKTPPAREIDKDIMDQIVIWGKNNDEPRKIINTINGSITGKSCLNTIRKYIYGKGLNIEPFDVAPGYSSTRLHRELSSQVSKLMGVALLVKYRPGGGGFEIAELKKMPFESLRLGIPEDGVVKKVKYNPYWGLPDYKPSDTIEYDLFDDKPEVIREQMRGKASKWKGQIFYQAMTSEFNEFYPLPDWWSNNNGKGGGRKWMEIEQLIGDFHSHNINKGFLQQILLKIVGDPDEPIPEDNEKKAEGKPFRTVGKEFEEHFNKNFAGAEGAKALIMWAANRDEFAELTPFPSVTNHDLFLALQKITTENILIATQVPPVLAGVKVSGTLSKDDIENSVKMMWANVEESQNFLEEIYNKLFKLMPEFEKKNSDDVTIMNYSPVLMSVDPLIWEAMSPADKRKWIIDNTDIELDELQEPTGNKE